MTKWQDRLTQGLIIFASLIVALIIGHLLWFIFIHSRHGVNWEFLTQNPSGIPLGSEGGIFGAIVGSLLLLVIAMVIAATLGIGCAIYLFYYCRSSRLKDSLQLLIYSAASIPSVLYGLFGYGFLIVSLHIPRSLLTAGMTIGLMVTSTVIIQVQELFATVPAQYLIDSQAMGLSLDYIISHLILPHCKYSLTAIIITAGSYAVGATSPLLLTGVVMVAGVPHSLLEPVMALPYHLNMLLSQTGEIDNAYATAFVLIILLTILHLVSLGVAKLGGKRLNDLIRR